MTKADGAKGLGKELAFHGAIYALTNLISRAVGFIMIPVYTRALTTEEYGIIELMEMSFAILGLIAGVRMAGAILRFYFDKEDPAYRRRIVSSGMLSCIAVSVLAAVAMLPLCGLVADFLFGVPEYAVLLRMGLVSFVFNFLVQMAYAYVRIEKRSILFLVVSLANLVLALSLNILFIVHMDLGVRGVLYSGMIASGATCIPLLIWVFRRVGTAWDWESVKAMYVFTFPLILGSLWSLAEEFLSRYFIRAFTTLAQVGVYSLAYKFGVILNYLVTGPFFNIWHVKCWELAKLPDGPQRMARVFTLFNFVSVAGVLAIALPSREIVGLLADEAFRPAAEFIPPIAFTNLLNSHYYFFTFGLHWSKQTRIIGTISWITGAVTIALDIVLIKSFGLWGAAAAFFLAAVLRNSLTYPAGQKLFRIPYQVRPVLLLYAAAGAAFAASRLVPFDHLAARFAWQGGLLVAFVAAVYLSGFFTRAEIDTAKAFAGARLAKLGLRRKS